MPPQQQQQPGRVEIKMFAPHTYIFKAVFAKLHHEMEKNQSWEPQAPHDHLLNGLHIQDSKDENEFVEDKVPKFVFEMLQGMRKEGQYNYLY